MLLATVLAVAVATLPSGTPWGTLTVGPSLRRVTTTLEFGTLFGGGPNKFWVKRTITPEGGRGAVT